MSAPTIEPNHDGSFVVSDVIDGFLVRRRYYGYTRREARALFRRETQPQPNAKRRGTA